MSHRWERIKNTFLTSDEEQIEMVERRPVRTPLLTSTQEALWFAIGSDFGLEDDNWDPQERDENTGLPIDLGSDAPIQPGPIIGPESSDEESDRQKAADSDKNIARASALPADDRPRLPGGVSVPDDLPTTEDFVLLGQLLQDTERKRTAIKKLEVKLNQLSAEEMEVHKSAVAARLNRPPNENGVEAGSEAEEKVGILNADLRERVEEADQRNIEREREEINDVYLPQKTELQELETRLNSIKWKIQKDWRVHRARAKFRNQKTRGEFMRNLFKSLQKGRLADVQVLAAVLDLDGAEYLISLDNIVEPNTNLSVLHVAMMSHRDDVVKFLVEHSRDLLARKAVDTKECQNLTPFIIAAHHGNVEQMKLVLEAVPKDEGQRADYINTPFSNIQYAGMPFDELPLAGAVWACLSKEDNILGVNTILEYLVQNGADLEMATFDGNTFLHLLVLQTVESIANLSYFRKILNEVLKQVAGIWWKRRTDERANEAARKRSRRWKISMSEHEVRGMRYLMNKENKDGLTPLALAADVESPLYLDLIDWKDIMRYPDPKLGHNFAKVDTYDITHVTSLTHDFKYNWTSIMHVVGHNHVDLSKKVWKQDLTRLEPMRTIVDEKWVVYSWFFYLWGVIHMVNMSLFTFFAFSYTNSTTTEQIPSANNASNVESPENPSNVSSLEKIELPEEPGNPLFFFFLLLPLGYIIAEIVDVCTSLLNHSKTTTNITGNLVYRLIAVAFSIFTALWYLLHMLHHIDQDVMLSMALLFGWLFGIFFTRTIRFPSRNSQIGAFSIMVQRMLLHDLIPFLLISCFVLIAFSAAIHATLIHSDQAPPEVKNYGLTFFQMLKYYSALEEQQGYDNSRERELAKTLLSVYGIISVVLLINMLIAAMNKTYDMVRETRTDLVARQRLAILLLLERRLPFACIRRWSEQKFSRFKSRVFVKIVHQSLVSRLVRSRRNRYKKNNVSANKSRITQTDAKGTGVPV